MSNVSFWLWPILSVVFLILWLWAMFRNHHEQITVRSSTPQQAHQRVEAEDLLKIAYHLQEQAANWNRQNLVCRIGLSEFQAEQAIAALLALDWIEEDEAGNLALTVQGETRAKELIRAHRLWERYLVEREAMPLEQVHAEAHRREHSTTKEEMEALDIGMGHPAWDPHGHAIPGPGRRAPTPIAHSLSKEGEPGTRLRIVSMDDEPASLLAQLFVMGFKPDLEIEIQEREEDCLRVKLNGDVVPLAGAAAHHLFVVPAPALAIPLGELPIGSRARVVEIKGGGQHQRRMLDMGFVPGATILVIRRAPLGDPTEYLVKGSAVALREADAETIRVEDLSNG